MKDIIKLENKLRKLAVKHGLNADDQEKLIANGIQRYEDNRINVDFFTSPNYNIIEDMHSLLFYNGLQRKEAISYALEHTTPHLDK